MRGDLLLQRPHRLVRQLELPHARLVVDAWRHRTADLMARPGVAHVFCFENRGEEIGVTLTHPHGQIYGYPYLPPRAAMMLREARAHAERTGGNLFTDILAHEVADGSRIIARTELFTAFVPFAARWPVEVHIYPNRFVHNLVDLTDAELDGFAQIYLDVLGRFDRMYPTALPYISALHQYANTDRTARRLLPCRADVGAAQRDQAEVPGRFRVGDGRVHQRRHPGKRGAAPAGARMTAIRYAAPGRINLIGEHTDYNLGFALPIALPERTVVTYVPDDGAEIVVRSDREDGDVRIPLDTAPGDVPAGPGMWPG